MFEIEGNLIGKGSIVIVDPEKIVCYEVAADIDIFPTVIIDISDCG